jgi:predicted ATP-dependent endonuclease of OLD family
MKVHNVEINNYRSCIQTKFDLPNNLMALIGANGVGKSNILYGLQMFSKSERNRRFFSEQSKEDLLSTSINLIVEFEEKIIFIRAKFFYQTDERNNDEIYYTELKYRIQGQNSRKWNSVNPVIFEFIEYLKKKRITEYPKEFQSEKAKFSIRLVRSLSNISYYSATQFSDPSKCPISIELDDFRISHRASRANRTHQQFIFDLYRAYKSQEPSFTLFLNTVGQNGLGLIDNIEFRDHEIPSSSYKVRAGGQIQQIENSKTIVVPSIIIDGLTLSPNQLSEGTFKTLALVFYILNDENEFLLIEEPEVCVHHGLLNSILQLIKQQSRHKQIIISTHSDYVLDMLEPENILLVHKTSDKGTKANAISNMLSANDYRILKDYLEQEGNLGEYWKEGGFDDE